MLYSAFIIHGIAVDDKNSCYNICMVEQKVMETIEKRRLLQKGDSVVAGISGGPDSVCLLHLLHGLSEAFALSLYAVHVHHGLRGAEADADRQYTEDFCAHLGVPLRVFSFDVKKMAEEQGLTTEEMGRLLRYTAFEQVREKLLAETKTAGTHISVKIAVAQNQNDQAETVLMRIMRGTGIDGLAGMEYMRDGTIIRPLLDVSRAEIEAYNTRKGLSPRIDSTNLAPDYTRNKIRLELIPYIQNNFNENILEGLSRLARTTAEDKSFLYECVEDAARRLLLDRQEVKGSIRENTVSTESIYIDRKGYRELSPAIAKRLILKVTKQIGLLQDMTAVHLDSADQMIRTGTAGSHMDLPHGFGLMVSYNEIRFSAPSEKILGKSFCYRITLGEITEIPESNARFRVKVIPAVEAAALSTGNDSRAFLSADPDLWKQPVYIRTRRPGDRIAPLGMTGTKKLQDYFVDQKIPREKRDEIPLVCCGQEVLWIVGSRISEKYKVKNNAEKVVSLEFICLS